MYAVMEQVDISRRSFVKGVGIGAVALMLARFGLTDALEPEVADALTVPVDYRVVRRINYDNFFTWEFRVNGKYLGFCCNPSHRNPPTGFYGDVHDDPAWGSSAWHNPSGTLLQYVRSQLYKIMWCGIEGPGYTPSFFPPTWYNGGAMDWDRRLCCQHILLSDIYALDFNAAVYGCSQAFRNWALQNITGVASDGTVIAGSMRAHVSADKDGGDWSSFPDADPNFKVYIMDAGNDSHGQPYQRIMFAEPTGRVIGAKSAKHSDWL